MASTATPLSPFRVPLTMTIWQAGIPVCFLLFILKQSPRLNSGVWLLLGAVFLGWLITSMIARQDAVIVSHMEKSAAADIATKSLYRLMATVNVFVTMFLIGIQFAL